MKNSEKMKFTTGENLPVEVLRFKTALEDVQEFLKLDHEIWTVMECDAPGFDESPFLYKETWLNDNNPGEIIVVFIWRNQQAWDKVGVPELQQRLAALFDEKFNKPYEFLGGLSGAEVGGVRRVCRFAMEGE